MPEAQPFRCPSCGANLSLSRNPGATVTCSYCGTSVLVPPEYRPPVLASPASYAPALPADQVVYAGPALQQVVAAWLLHQASQQTGVRLAGDAMVSERINNAAVLALRSLSDQPSATVNLPFLTADASGPKHFLTVLTRETVDRLAMGTLKP